MTNPDQSSAMTEVRLTVDGIKTTLQKLERAVQGDPDAGTPSLRQAIRSVAEELNDETDSLCDRLDKLEHAASRQEAYSSGMMTVIKWLGGSSLAALVGLIAALIKLFGGSP